MADPTLVGDITSFEGFTLTQIVEALLTTRGMTLDSATMRVVASTTEQDEATRRVLRAFMSLNVKFPSVFSERKYTVSWTSGDSMLVLPDAARSVLYVLYGGKNVRPIKREDELRIIQPTAAGGGFQIDMGGYPGYYRIVGYADAGTNDLRPVIKLFPTPTSPYAAETIIIGYNAKAPLLTLASDGSKALPIFDYLQEWVLYKARWIWASDEGDETTKRQCAADIAEQESMIQELLDGSSETPDRIRWEYPTLPGYTRDE